MIICSSLVSSHRCCCMSPHFTGLRVCKLLVWLRGIRAADWWRRPHCTPPSTSSSSTELTCDPQHTCWGYSKLWQGQVTCPRLTRNVQMGVQTPSSVEGESKSPQELSPSNVWNGEQPWASPWRTQLHSESDSGWGLSPELRLSKAGIFVHSNLAWWWWTEVTSGSCLSF